MSAALRCNIVTLFPDYFVSVLSTSILGRALRNNILNVQYYNIRDYSTDTFKHCDDTPYGGGAGMVLMAEPLESCLKNVRHNDPKTKYIFLTAAGKPLTHDTVVQFQPVSSVTLVCGHYEGIDDRIIQQWADVEITIGDFIVSGGEPAAAIFIDALIRHRKGALGNDESVIHESFSNGLLEHRQYTRPFRFNKHCVPDVLRSGNHKRITQWRDKDSLVRSFERRPDLFSKYPLRDDDKKYMYEYLIHK